jgi:hypothetical protein
MEIDGHQFLIARPLTTWEYVWMAIPALLIILGGGLIGGAVGMAAVFSNSILLRRIRHWLPRYVFTGATTAVAFFLFFRVSTVVTPFVHSISSNFGGQTVEEQLVTTAAEMNKRCPIMLDDETRADSVSAGPGKALTYNYTLVKRSVKQLDIPRLMERLRPSIAHNAKTNPDLEHLRELQVTFVYKYADKNGSTAFDLTVGPPEYH